MHHQIPLIFSLLISVTFLIIPQLKAVKLCSPFSCNRHVRDPIQFPFRVPDNQTTRCGYPGFELSCNSNGQTLLPLSSKTPLVVEGISYPDQLLWLSDPDHCIPKLVMNLSFVDLVSTTPYMFGPSQASYAYLNCSRSRVTKEELPMGSSVISCMSEGDYTVVVTFDERAEEEMVGSKRRCEVLKRVNAAFWWRHMEYGYYPMDLSDVYLQLSWEVPNCGECASRGGDCAFIAGSGLQVGCFIPSSSGFPRSAKYGLILGAGVPALLCIIGLTFYASSRVRNRNSNRRVTNTESTPSVFPQPIVLTLGLDEPTIESYPKTVLGESKRLPKPSDNTCPICLSEYQPKETLRSIPECNHYFHSDCIDEWLRMNATCPLCRKSPQPSDALPVC